MRVSARTEIPQLFLIAAMFAVAALTWSSAPERIPVHWGLSGEADGYAGKFWGLLGQPLLTIGIYLLMLFLPRLDPRRANYAKFAGVYLVFRYMILLFLATTYGLVVLWARGIEAAFPVVMPAMVGLLFVVSGNLFGKLRPNRVVGVRTPWTLRSKRSWVQSHRLGGWMFVFLGFAILVCALVRPSLAGYATGIGLLSCVAFLIFYSYLVWREDPEARSFGAGRRREG